MSDDVNNNLLGALLAFADDDQLPGAAPSGETSAHTGGIHVHVLMPDGRPGELQRQGSANSVMTPDISSAFSPSPPPTAVSPARARLTHMDSPDCWFHGLELETLIHTHADREDPDTEDTEHIVSTLSFFTVEVGLVNSSKELVGGVHVGLSASLVYENGQAVVLQPGDETEILKGETGVVIIDGRGVFRLQMGPSVLSSKHGKQRFRVKIAPSSEHLCSLFPDLTVLSQPIKSMAKPNRKPSASRGGGGGDRPSAPPPTKRSSPSPPAPGLHLCCTARKRTLVGPVLVRPVAAARPSVDIMAAAPSVGIVANARAIPSLTELIEKSELMLHQLKQIATSLKDRIPGGNAER